MNLIIAILSKGHERASSVIHGDHQSRSLPSKLMASVLSSPQKREREAAIEKVSSSTEVSAAGSLGGAGRDQALCRKALPEGASGRGSEEEAGRDATAARQDAGDDGIHSCEATKLVDAMMLGWWQQIIFVPKVSSPEHSMRCFAHLTAAPRRHCSLGSSSSPRLSPHLLLSRSRRRQPSPPPARTAPSESH